MTDLKQQYVSVSRLLQVRSLNEREVAKILEKDTDQDGKLTVSELLKVIEDQQDDVRRSNVYRYLFYILASLSIALIAAVCGITYGIVDATRSISSDDGLLVSRSTNTVLSIGSATNASSIGAIYGAGSTPESIKSLYLPKENGSFGVYMVESILVYRNINATITLETGEKILVNENGVQLLNDTMRVTRGLFDGLADAANNAVEAAGTIAADAINAAQDAVAFALENSNKLIEKVEYTVSSPAFQNNVAKLKGMIASCVSNPSASNNDCANFLTCNLVDKEPLQSCLDDNCNPSGDKEKLGLSIVSDAIERCTQGSFSDCQQVIPCMEWVPFAISLVDKIKYVASSPAFQIQVTKLKTMIESCAKNPSLTNSDCTNFMDCGSVIQEFLQSCTETKCDSVDDLSKIGMDVIYGKVNRCSQGQLSECQEIAKCMGWISVPIILE